MTSGEAAVTVGVVTEAGMIDTAGDPTSVNFGGIVAVVILEPFLSIN